MPGHGPPQMPCAPTSAATGGQSGRSVRASVSYTGDTSSNGGQSWQLANARRNFGDRRSGSLIRGGPLFLPDGKRLQWSRADEVELALSLCLVNQRQDDRLSTAR
jgi:hypothetical protein